MESSKIERHTIIRPAVLGDIDVIFEIHTEAIKNVETRHYSIEQIAKWAERQTKEQYTQPIRSGCIFVASQADKVIGFGHLKKGRGEIDKKYEVKELFIHPLYSRKGVGRNLLRHIEQIAKDDCCNELVVNSSFSAVPFYQANGFMPKEIENHTSSCSSCAIQCHKMTKCFNFP